jgi:hypothetical protein
VKILLGNLNIGVGRKENFKIMTGNETLYKINIDNGVGVENFATPRNLSVKSKMFPHRN